MSETTIETGAGDHANPPKIRLGNTIRDAVTGFTGTAFQYMEEMNGNLRWTIQPKAKDNDFPEAYMIDANMVDYVDEGLASRVPPIPETPFKIGDKVRHIMSGYTGVIANRTVFINGCVVFGVVADAKKGGKEFGSVENISWEQLEKVGEEKKVTRAAANGKKTGGPSVRGAIRSAC